MDRSRAELLVRSIVTRADRLGRELPAVEPSRGSSIVPLLQYICKNIATKAEIFGSELMGAPDEDVDSYLRSLQQLLKVESSLHEYASKYRFEIDRHDLPVGLLYLVDSIVLAMLGSEFDPLIHTDHKRNYSTDSLLHDLQPLIKHCDGEYGESMKPVIFNVPGIDPANAFLAPILVHEATHTYLRTSSLLADARSAIPATVQDSAAEYTAHHGSPWPNRVFENWISELLCDCMAVLTTGPSFPLAISALAASFDAVPLSETHPFMCDRVVLMWNHMKTLGWEPLIGEFPVLRSWFESIGETSDRVQSAAELSLRAEVLKAGPGLLEVCRDHVGEPLDPSIFSSRYPGIRQLVVDKIPPAEVEGISPSPWEIILTGWLVALAGSTTSADLATIVDDSEMSRFLIKSVELSAIASLWRSDDFRT